MEKYSRSKSSREVAVHQQQPSSMYDLRSYSTTEYSNPAHQNMEFHHHNLKEMKAKKGNKSSRIWGFNMDPELQRKKRVAGYKAYAVEGRMKGSFRKSFRWIKDTCNHVVHGFW